ncbi:helix-turn-helix, psq domain-containing protein [Hirsutella rhossiliensis]|uniref:Helix-turn-helix, psq domain-containing protein n=1 Tax=Hirsutella rhossiliensis TaxID=111463 RepID=A0A9P8N860_9HYPO|nr:helix-turn-helix, psq domain-containing protein [Hirsutella rhossiliensis]KAH0968747.1 helix-turn-helix, psq domain-containing protein [Hirsutella rhossiliensis]
MAEMPPKRPRRIYTEERMATAINYIMKNGLSQYHAAQKYDIPQQSISNRLKGQSALADQIQPHQLLSKTQEALLVSWSRNWTSFIEAITADGRALTPGIIFKGKELQQQWMNGWPRAF